MTWTLQLTRQDLALIATGLYYAERVYDSAALTARAEGSLTQAAVDAEVAERGESAGVPARAEAATHT